MSSDASICPDCQEELVKTKKRYVCDECDFTCLIDELEPPSAAWDEVLFADDNQWVNGVSSESPYIIAHEYSRLRVLLGEKKFFGLLLQIKDFVEVLLKMYVILEVKKQGASELYSELLAKPLSLGDWERIARSISTKLGKNSPVGQILKFYSKNKITNWRNEKIGHGALSFDDDPEFVADIEGKIKAINQLLGSIKEDLVTLQFSLESGQSSKSLNGTDINNLASEGEIVSALVSLAPLIIFKDQKVFLFDSFLTRSKVSMYVDYPTGKKIKINSIELNKIFDSMEQDKLVANFSGQSIDESYLACEESALKQIDSKSDYIIPKLVVTELEGQLEAFTKGVFLLQMERGTGKTSFSRALDDLDWGRIKFDDTVQRAYYINDTYLSGVDAFVVDARDSLRCDKNGRVAIKGKLPDLSADSPTPDYDFATMLNEYRKAHEKHFGYSKLLFVFDGIDELGTGEKSISDFIPSPELLDEGVYILLTSRTDNEITAKTKDILSRVESDKTTIVTKGSSFIKDVFIGYLQKHFKISSNEDLLEEIQALCDNRIVYLKVLKDLHACEHIPFKLEEVPSYQEILGFYFDAIGSFYDESSLISIKRLLTVIAIAEEPLDVYDIAYLMNEHSVSFRLLSYLSDLRGFLRVERSVERNKFFVSNKKISELVLQNFGEESKELIVEWLQMLSSIQKLDFSSSGLMYLTSNISSLVDKYNVNMGDCMDNVDIKTLASLKEQDWSEYPKERSIKTLSNALSQAQRGDDLETYFQILVHVPANLRVKVIDERAKHEDTLLTKVVEQKNELFNTNLLPFFRQFSAALFSSHLYNESIELAGFIFEKTGDVIDLVNVISFCKGGGSWAQAEKLIQNTLQEKHKNIQPENKAYISYVVGRLYIDQLNKFSEAYDLLDESVRTFSDSSPFHADMVSNSLAMYWLMSGDHNKAFEILERLYNLYMDDDRLSDSMKEAIANNYNISKVLCKKHISELDGFEFLNPEIKAYYFNNLAISEHLLGDKEKATGFLNRAEDISRKANKKYALAAVLNNKFCITSNSNALKETKSLCLEGGYSVGLEYVAHNLGEDSDYLDMMLLDSNNHSLWFCVKNVDLVWEGV